LARFGLLAGYHPKHTHRLVETKTEEIMKIKHLLAGGSLLALSTLPVAHAGATLDAVKAKGFVQCGVSTGLPGFSATNDKGQWTGLDVDVCRAVAAAVFGDAILR
jgi:general L-amino acid transport system substrate-binding protein